MRVYRRYRPDVFAGVFGQDHVISPLTSRRSPRVGTQEPDQPRRSGPAILRLRPRQGVTGGVAGVAVADLLEIVGDGVAVGLGGFATLASVPLETS